MPRPNDSPDVAASKTLSYILRHGAEKEGLHIRSDGYIKLDDVLARPKMRDVDKSMVFRLVQENAKKRFELFYGYDPSPPPPKKGKGQGKGQGQGQGSSGRAQKKERAPRPSRGSEDGPAARGDTATAASVGNGNGKQGSMGSRAAQDKAAGTGGESKDEKRNRRAAKLAARATVEPTAASLQLASSSPAGRGAELNDAPSYSAERESLVEKTSGMVAVGFNDTVPLTAESVANAATPDAGASTMTLTTPARAESGEAPTLEPLEPKSQPQPQPRTDSKSNSKPKPKPKPKPEVKSESTAVTVPAPSTELPLVPLPLPSIESTPASVTGSGSIADADADANAAAVSDMTDMTQGIAATSLSNEDAVQPLAPAAAAETPPRAPVPASTASADSTTSDATPPQPQVRGEYFIRASQGHSIALASTSHLVPITYTTTTTTTAASTSDPNPNPDPTSTSSPATQRHSREISPADRARAGLLVHGTHLHLYPLIASTGLSRMGRQHIHLAPALSAGVGGDTDSGSENLIAPRTGSTLLIYLDLDKLLAAGIQVYTSANGVVLTPGDAEGRVKRELWKRVEEVRENGRGERVVIWDAEMGDVGEA